MARDLENESNLPTPNRACHVHSESSLCAAPHTVALHEGGITFYDPENSRPLKLWLYGEKIETSAGGVLQENVSSIRNIYMECVLPQTLNVPHGGVATTMGLGTFPTNMEQFSYNNTNFLSCMTLDMENLHVFVHHKK
ncbi:unnamed protein product [Porites evermanni]|uniref:Uncharacterized protein n=1 Tax=Porites evermanni TaxID=104178 RepID=A0ABN8QNG3_9CNID|nr:unnamed protein product [Porites evermanni]